MDKITWGSLKYYARGVEVYASGRGVKYYMLAGRWREDVEKYENLNVNSENFPYLLRVEEFLKILLTITTKSLFASCNLRTLPNLEAP